MTAEVIHIAPFVRGPYEEHPKDNCGYAFLRLEHECLATMKYLKIGADCNLMAAKVALRALFVRMKALEVCLWDVEKEKKLYQQVEDAWGLAYSLQNKLVAIENLSDQGDMKALISQVDQLLADIQIKLSPVIPLARPKYEPNGDWLAVLTKVGRA